MDSAEHVHIDIQDFSNILQCIGFKIKSVTKEFSFSDKNERIIELSCKNSGIKITFESESELECNCPKINDANENEKWEMSGTSGGVQVTKIESHSAFQKTFSKSIMSHVKNELDHLFQLLRTKTKVTITPRKNALLNKSPSKDQESIPAMTSFSASSSNLLSSPPRIALQIRAETPSRYRSLDTLNDINSKTMILPEPKVLSASQKSVLEDSNQEVEQVENNEKDQLKRISRQNTYTTSPTTSTHEPRHMLPMRTSSLITMIPPAAILNLHQAEKLITDLSILINDSIQSLENNGKRSLSPSIIDVSGISISKSQTIESKRSNSILSLKSPMPYASSPNLSSRRNSVRTRLNTPTVHLKSPAIPAKPDTKTGSLKRSIPKKFPSIRTISPSFGIVSSKKNLGVSSVLGNPVVGSYKSLPDRSITQNTASKLRSSFKSSLTKTGETENKKKDSLYGHIKSTIPRANSAKK